MSYKERNDFDHSILKHMNESGGEIPPALFEDLYNPELINERMNIMMNMNTNQFNTSLFSSSSSSPSALRSDTLGHYNNADKNTDDNCVKKLLNNDEKYNNNNNNNNNNNMMMMMINNRNNSIHDSLLVLNDTDIEMDNDSIFNNSNLGNNSNNHSDVYNSISSNNLCINESMNSDSNQNVEVDSDFITNLKTSSPSIIYQNCMITTRTATKHRNNSYSNSNSRYNNSDNSANINVSKSSVPSPTITTATTSSRVHRGQSQAAKERRRERNKVLARKTRIKKKAELETLRSELMNLRGENDRLKDVLKCKLPSNVGDNIVRECEIQLPDNVANAVQVLLSRSERADVDVLNETNNNNENDNNDNNKKYYGNDNIYMDMNGNNVDCFSTNINNMNHHNIINVNDSSIINYKYSNDERKVSYCIANAMIPIRPIIYASEGFCDLSGYSIENILGKNYDFLQGPDTDQNEINKIRSKMEMGQDCQVTVLNYRSNGTTFWNRVQISPLFNYQSQIALFIVIQNEISATEASIYLRLETHSNFTSMTMKHSVDV